MLGGKWDWEEQPRGVDYCSSPTLILTGWRKNIYVISAPGLCRKLVFMWSALFMLSYDIIRDRGKVKINVPREHLVVNSTGAWSESLIYTRRWGEPLIVFQANCFSVFLTWDKYDSSPRSMKRIMHFPLSLNFLTNLYNSRYWYFSCSLRV